MQEIKVNGLEEHEKSSKAINWHLKNIMPLYLVPILTILVAVLMTIYL